MRVSPVGIWAAGDPERAAQCGARGLGAHASATRCASRPAPAIAAAIAAGVGGGEPRGDARRGARPLRRPGARGDRARAPRGALPAQFEKNHGLGADRAAERVLPPAPSRLRGGAGRDRGRGGDTDTNAAIAGALLGAAHGREAIPARWILPVLACRPLVEAGAPRPRPMAYWPDDVLELAEALLR